MLVGRFHEYLAAAPIGFDEASGNFQRTNASGAGLGDDYIRAEVNDGQGVNNANFVDAARRQRAAHADVPVQQAVT